MRRTPLGRLRGLLGSVPGSLLYNPPAFKLHDELQLHPENRVLDIGCGRGSLLQLLQAQVAFHKPPVGIDISRTLLQPSRPEGRELDLLQGEGRHLPLADDSFDVVTCGYTAHRLEDRELLALLREVRRVLTPGGIALLWDFSLGASPRLNAFHTRLLGLETGECVLRGYMGLSSIALYAGFEWVSNAHLRPYFFPPIPRVSIILGKAPLDWKSQEETQGLVPDTHAQSLVAGVSRETEPHEHHHHPTPRQI